MRKNIGIVAQTAKFFEALGQDKEIVDGLMAVARDIQDVVDSVETAKAKAAKEAAMKEVEGDIKNARIKFAAFDKVTDFEDEVQLVLDALGYPRAMVTDQSKVSDFFLPVNQDMSDLEYAHFSGENRKMVAKACETLGIAVLSNELIVDVAKRLRNSMNGSWQIIFNSVEYI